MKSATCLSLLVFVPAGLGAVVPAHHRIVARQYGGGYGGSYGGASSPDTAGSSAPAASGASAASAAAPTGSPVLFQGAKPSGIGLIGVTSSIIPKEKLLASESKALAASSSVGGAASASEAASSATSSTAAAAGGSVASGAAAASPTLFQGAKPSGIGMIGIGSSLIPKAALLASESAFGARDASGARVASSPATATSAAASTAGASGSETGAAAASATAPPPAGNTARFLGAKSSGIGLMGVGSSVIGKDALAASESAQGIQASATAAAAPPSSSGSAASGDPNLTVLQFALQLEKLETEFYTQALKKLTLDSLKGAGFSTTQAKIMQQQMAIQLSDEQTHVKILEDTITSLGQKPFDGCSFALDAALTDPLTTISVARTVEAVGVGAYQGGAQLLKSAQLLEAAASILPIESRHQSALNLFAGGSLSPQPFDIAMSPSQVLALAGGFLQGCKASDLGLQANAPLSVIDGSSQSTFFSTGSVLQFQTSAASGAGNASASGLSCQMVTGSATTATVMPANACIIAPGMNGPVAVFLTSNATPLAANLAAQDASAIVAGPALIYVDSSKEELFPQLFTDSSNKLGSIPSANLGAAGLAAAAPQQANAQMPPMFSWGNKGKPSDS